jgi:hypothetical protein
VDADVMKWLSGRADLMGANASPHLQAAAELTLWRETLAAELGKVRMSCGEAACLADISHRATLDTNVSVSLSLLYGKAFDAFRADFDTTELSGLYGKKHGIDEQALLNKLVRLTPTQDHALRDALARWWALDTREATPAGFAQVDIFTDEHRAARLG